MSSGIFIIFLCFLLLFAIWKYTTSLPENVSAPFVPTESKIVKRMLEIADIKDGEILYDLGSGDGRIVVSAALRKIKAVGIEIDPVKVFYSRFFIKSLKLEKYAQIIRGNFFDKDLSQANVVTLFLLHDTNQKLKDKFKKELKKGTRIVSYSFIMEGWKPVKKYFNKDSVWGPIYLYKV